MATTIRDPFALLGVPEETDDDCVRRAYLQQVRSYPPDRYPERFQEIRQAYEAIGDVRSRMAARLFDAPPADLLALLAPVLEKGAPMPPTEQSLLNLLSVSLKGFRLPNRAGE